PHTYSFENQHYIDEVGVSSDFISAKTVDVVIILWILMRFFVYVFFRCTAVSLFGVSKIFQTVIHASAVRVQTHSAQGGTQAKIRRVYYDARNVKHKNLRIMKKNIFRLDSS
ncbi:MAG: hypothetical protein LBG28_15860, partial [Tannerella sp.]|nr:hypothetical protein [Tannerella sp.]